MILTVLIKFDGIIIILGKGNVERTLTLTPKISRALEAYKPVREDILRQRNRLDEKALFLSEKRGDRITRRGLEFIIEQIAKEASVKAGAGFKVGPHKLRHICRYSGSCRTSRP